MIAFSKRARTTVAGLVAVGALTTGAIVVPQLALANVSTVSATTALNVRAQPNTSSQILGVLSSGEQVERRGDPQGQWTPVRYRGQDAWVFSEFVSLGNLNAASGGTATATAPLNIRVGSSTLTPVIGVLRVGESVAVTGGQSGGWIPVSYQGRSGYAYAAYLSFDSSTSAPATNPSAGGTGSATATTAVNVRSGPSTSNRILSVLNTGQSIAVRGASQNGWTPVTFNGQDAWVSSEFLSTGGGQPAAATSTAYTTTGVNLRTGPSTGYRIVRVLATNTAMQLTGLTQDGFSQVNDDGQLRWISTTYLSSSPVSNTGGGATQGPNPPAGSSGSTSLNTGGSVGLDQLRDTTKQVVYAIRQNYPQIATMYGYRPDPLPDHPSGRAVDIMMPRGANDQALGDQIAAYLQANADSLNIEYLIWRQRIWINGQGGWTWMADRGGITANHYDHVHVTVRS